MIILLTLCILGDVFCTEAGGFVIERSCRETEYIAESVVVSWPVALVDLQRIPGLYRSPSSCFKMAVQGGIIKTTVNYDVLGPDEVYKVGKWRLRVQSSSRAHHGRFLELTSANHGRLLAVCRDCIDIPRPAC